MATASRELVRATQLVHDFYYVQDQAPSEKRTPLEWISAFREVGFFTGTGVTATLLNGMPMSLMYLDFADTRPRKAARVFRVCDPGKEHHPHWTRSLDIAIQFAVGGKSPVQNHENAHMFTAVVSPKRVLALLDQEWVVDTSGLRIDDLGTVEAIPPTRMSVMEIEEEKTRSSMIARFGPDATVEVTPPFDRFVLDGSLALWPIQQQPGGEA